MKVLFLLIWFRAVPDVGVSYHHLGSFDNETKCETELRRASVLVNDKLETIECIQVQVYN